ncbi:bifunctional DNA primase/polymerase [Nonomuraea diastatica]|nr:bifunctional DNA primase/polymerase [Nonomuraea diastatica]
MPAPRVKDGPRFKAGASGVLGVDLDVQGDVDGIARFAAACTTYGQPWPDTLTVRTPHGLHLYFTVPADRIIGSASGTTPLGPGVDTRGPKTSGKTLGRPAAIDQDKAAAIVEEYRQGAAVKALARRHQVAPKTIRRVLDAAGARDLPGQPARRRPTPASSIACPRWARTRPSMRRDCSPITCVPLVMQPSARPSPPGRPSAAATATRSASRPPLALHCAALEQSAALADAGPTERKAHRVYAARVTAVQGKHSEVRDHADVSGIRGMGGCRGPRIAARHTTSWPRSWSDRWRRSPGWKRR